MQKKREKENKKNGHKLELNDGGEKNNSAPLFPVSLQVICIRRFFFFFCLILNQLTPQNKTADKHCEELKLNISIKQLR